MKNFTTKLLCFKSLENFVLKIVHCGHNLGAHMKKIGWICPGSRSFWEIFFKKCRKVTKGTRLESTVGEEYVLRLLW